MQARIALKNVERVVAGEEQVVNEAARALADEAERKRVADSIQVPPFPSPLPSRDHCLE